MTVASIDGCRQHTLLESNYLRLYKPEIARDHLKSLETARERQRQSEMVSNCKLRRQNVAVELIITFSCNFINQILQNQFWNRFVTIAQ